MVFEIPVPTTEFSSGRAVAARRAGEALMESASAWAKAAKHQVGAVALPADRSAARAFDAFVAARSELSHHLGGEIAARLANEAFAAASRA